MGFEIDADKRTDATKTNLCCCVLQVTMFWVYFACVACRLFYFAIADKASIDRSATTVSKQRKVTLKPKENANRMVNKKEEKNSNIFDLVVRLNFV